MHNEHDKYDFHQSLKELENILDKLLTGRLIRNSLNIDAFSEDIQPLAEKIMKLSHDITELKLFSREISSGNLDAEPPNRQNLLCGEIKEIHSQYSSFCWSLEQLVQGNVVSKLYYPGELFEIYNELISKISKILSTEDASANDFSSTISSWRYHQILAAINELNIIIIEVDDQGNILFKNPPAAKITDLPEKQIPYGNTEIANPLIQYLCSFENTVTDAQKKNPLKPKYSELRECHDYVNNAWYRITSNLIQLADGNFGLLHAIDDISEWKKHESILKRSANYDTLTSAYTRKAGLAILEEFMQNRRGTSCIAFCDVDGLKQINDSYGHNEGDFAIQAIAEIFLECVRNSDSVVRYGGDEFLILFPNCEISDIEKVIQRMYHRLDTINKNSEKPYQLSFSVGYTDISSGCNDINDLIADVDEKMYAQKKKKYID